MLRALPSPRFRPHNPTTRPRCAYTLNLRYRHINININIRAILSPLRRPPLHRNKHSTPPYHNTTHRISIHTNPPITTNQPLRLLTTGETTRTFPNPILTISLPPSQLLIRIYICVSNFAHLTYLPFLQHPRPEQRRLATHPQRRSKIAGSERDDESAASW